LTISLDSTGNVDLAGRLVSSGGAVLLKSGGKLTIDGAVGEGLSASGSIKAPTLIQSPLQVSLTVGGTLDLLPDASLEAKGTGAVGSISITAASATLSGSIDAGACRHDQYNG
jgi:hypothetical protein